jgi:hypothetical protein
VEEIIDSSAEIISTVLQGADLIFTRYPHVAVQALATIPRAIPVMYAQDLPPLTPPYLVPSQRSANSYHVDECRCQYFFDDRDDQWGGRVDGCVIRHAAPVGRACYCERLTHPLRGTPLKECRGHAMLCPDTSNIYCADPDVTLSSCRFAGGDCGGYNYWSGNWECECAYKRGGCVISRPAPANGACKCFLKGPLNCDATVTFCKDMQSDQCVKPDTSLASCLASGPGGNCNGYVAK